MGTIINEKQAAQLGKKIKSNGQKIVLAGGCFDLIHIGHVKFLKAAKKLGTLFILLESDESIKKLKGGKRPMNPIEERSEILSSLEFVDYIVELKGVKNGKDYDKIVSLIKPDYIAITKGDCAKSEKENQARSIKAKIIEVTPEIKNRSSSRLEKLMEEI